MKTVASVDEYLSQLDTWKRELSVLRELVNKAGMNEAIKWGMPVYSIQGKNVVSLGAFKSHFCLWFFQGALIEDTHHLLINAQEGKTKAQRQIRFTSAQQIKPRVISGYLKQAMALAKAGKEIKPDRNRPLEIPTELKAALARDRAAKAAFDKLTIGRQREFTEYVASAKLANTKQRRIEKILPMLKHGIGLNDKYRR
jgi:uncharacterized protein YdeI (YjbR/CyaY-like superfamily)